MLRVRFEIRSEFLQVDLGQTARTANPRRPDPLFPCEKQPTPVNAANAMQAMATKWDGAEWDGAEWDGAKRTELSGTNKCMHVNARKARKVG